jgi:hypothetical protein
MTAEQSVPGGTGTTALRWLVVLVAVLAIVAMLALVRGKPGVGGRAPHPRDAAGIIHSASGPR